MEFNEWLNKNSSVKNYAHFDTRVALKDVLDKIINPAFVIHHGFLPFIHYPLVFHKFSKQSGRKDKIRELYYSSHFDRCIYQYYSYLLNEFYNKKTAVLSISDVAIAYRTDLHKNNIHFAKEAFDFIQKQDACMIIVGDFKDFFDRLNHHYLKQRLCDLLGCDQLPQDYYKVFRSITKYSYVDLTAILEYYKLTDTKTNRKKLNSKAVIMPIQILRDTDLIQANKKNYGIPQGSAISAALSNIYMLEFDKKVNDYINALGGLYLRYSDDTIFIIPTNNLESENILKIHARLKEFVDSIPDLVLQTEKTKMYTFCAGELRNRDSVLGKSDDKNIIDYLGFSFDGKNISIRDKTISKYFYRAYSKADTIVKREGYTPSGKKISKKNLYNTYTLKGASGNQNNCGNFLSYVQRCKKIFGEKTNVGKTINTHYGKIKKRLTKQ